MVVALGGFAAAFALAATAGAGTSSPAQSTEPPPTTTEPPPPEEPPVEPPPSTPAPISFGVTVGGVKVGGLMPYQASKAVAKAYARQLVLVVDESRRIELAPAALGASANVPKAIRRARFARPGAVVLLDPVVNLHDVRVLELRRRLGFDHEALSKLHVVVELRIDGLQGNVAIEDGVPRLEDLPHAPAAQNAADFVTAYFLGRFHDSSVVEA